jgi:uncharacterized protein (TIGR02996 family)
MTEGDALLAAILATPDEDTPRLAYADWLDEHDQPFRAEFIRVQIELARMSSLELVPWNRRLLELRAREKTLLALHGNEWLAPLRRPGGPLESAETHGRFRRGFVEVVWMPASWFPDSAAILFESTPVRELRVTRTSPCELVELLASPVFPRLAGLDLSDRRLGDPVAELLSAAWNAGGLRSLRLRACGLTDAGGQQLADSPHDWPLRELDLSHNAIGPRTMAALRDRYGDAVHFVT